MTVEEAKTGLQQDLRSIYDDGEAAAVTHLVIEKITGLRRIDRLSQRSALLTASQQQDFDGYRGRLLQREPVQYVLEESWFCGFKFFVNRHVLIPRPETEELVEWIISNCKFPLDKLSILDIGTGSGCISAALKRKLRKSDVFACDNSAEALAVARRNAHDLGAAISFHEIDFLDPTNWSKLPLADIIVSNPPYIPASEEKSLDPHVRLFEPPQALFVPDNHPLVFYEAIAGFAHTHLRAPGAVYLELNAELARPTQKLFEQQGYATEIKTDMQGKERFLKAWR